MKIINDKYYTPIFVANRCWDIVLDVIGRSDISEIIEPSCGNGAFYHHPDIEPHFGYDIEPEFDNGYVFRGDFLLADIPYLQGRLVIGNPPYGARLNLAQKFYKKSVEMGDYVAFILPISQLQNNRSLYEFNLVHSEDLGVQNYSGRMLHCCFNVYARGDNGKLNKKSSDRSKYVKIYRQDSKGYEERDFDLRMCYWGDGTAGKILSEGEHYSGEYKIVITDKGYKDRILEFMRSFDWRDYAKSIAMKRVKQFHITDVINNYMVGKL